jgi:hypothetical protein
MIREDRSRLSTPLAVPAAALVAAAFFFWTFPLDLFTGSPRFWDNAGEDPTQAFSGYLAFAQDNWRFPLFRTQLLDPPGGANIIFMDSVPLLALLGKALYRSTGLFFNYFGAWLLLCYLMQAVLGVLIAREIGIRRFLPQFAVGLIVLFTPTFVYRYDHYALSGHFVILAAILFYLRTIRRPSPAVLWGFTALFAVTPLVNAYLFAMVGAIYFAAVAEAARRRMFTPWQAGRILLVAAAAVVAVMALCGGRALTSKVGIMEGFGYYSMNLLSPFWPQLSGIFPRGTPIVDATGGQYEGYGYLGLGVLVLLLLALVAKRGRAAAGLVSRHRYLLAVVLVMLAFAASLDVWVGHVELTHVDASTIPVFRSITGTFRSCGRFVWPLVYCLVIGGVAIVAQRFHGRQATALLVVAALVQFWDVLGARAVAQEKLVAHPLPFDMTVWTGIVKRHRAVIMEPHFICYRDPDKAVHREMLFIAAKLGIPGNSAVINRPNVDCDKDRNEAELAPFAESFGSPALHVFIKAIFSETLLVADKPTNTTCADTGFAIVCSSAQNPGFAAGTPGFSALAVKPYRLGADVNLADESGSRDYLGSGWSEAGTWGRWAEGRRTQMLLPLDHVPEQGLIFAARVHAFGDAHGYTVRKAAVSVNGQRLNDIVLADQDEHDIRFTIPKDLAAAWPILTIELQFDSPRSPKDIGLSIDPRPLTWGFRSFSISAANGS